MSNIKVAVRVRPLLNRETEQSSENIIEVRGDVVALTNLKVDPNNPYGDSRERVKHFSYDFCYNSTCKPDTPGYGSQEQIFQDLGTEVIQAAVEGYNACLFAYGQTSTGKTYTMTGTEDALGLIPRICEGLFAHVESTEDDQVTFKVEISYLEIYNERVRDLLKPCSVNEKYTLKVREHPKEGPYVQDLSVHKVKNCTEILGYLDKGNDIRTTAATHMHEHSSRSHAIVTLVFTQALFEDDLPREIISKIHLVDLAGSERADTTSTLNYKGRLKEGANINKSLVTLGNVIKALAERSLLSWTQMGSTHSVTSSTADGNSSPRRQQTVFIPYRDSVLTWLLRDSLGGNSKTIMISTITPASKYYNETLSTLRYAQRAKNIVNKPRINEDSNVALIRQLQEEIKRLRQELANAQLHGSMGDLFYLIPDSQNLSACSSDSDLQAGQKEKRNAGTVVEKLQEKEYIARQLTKSWKDKWSSTSTMQDDDVLSFHELRRASSHGIILDSQIPHLIGMDDDILSTGVIIYQLHIGKVCIGTSEADTEQDIVLTGDGIEKEHCYVQNDGNCVVFHPNPQCACKINGNEVDKPTQLQQGDVVILGNNKTFRFNNPAEAARLREHRQGSTSSLQSKDEMDGLLNVPKWEHQSNSVIPPFPMFNPNVGLTKKYKTEAERIEQAIQELEKTREELREKEKLLAETSELTSQHREDRKLEVEKEKLKVAQAYVELQSKKEEIEKLKSEFDQHLAEEQKYKTKIIEEIENLPEKSDDTYKQSSDNSDDATTIRKRKISREGRIKALAQEELVHKVSTIEKTKSLALQEEELEEEEESIQVYQEKVRAREKDYKALSRSWTEELSSKKEEVGKLEAQEDQIQAYIQEKKDLIKVAMYKPNPIRASYSETHLPSAVKPPKNIIHQKQLSKKVSQRNQHLNVKSDEKSPQTSKSNLQTSSPSSSKTKLYVKKLIPKKVSKLTSSAEDVTNRLYRKPVAVKHHDFLRKSSRHHLKDKPFRSPRDRTPLTTPAPQILHRPPKPIIHDPLKLRNFGGSDSNLSRPGLVRSRSRMRQIVSMSNLASVPEASYEAESEAELMHSAPDIPEAAGGVKGRNSLEPPVWERCSSMPTDGSFERAWENYSQSMGLKIASRSPDTSDSEQQSNPSIDSAPNNLPLFNMDFSRRKRASANRRRFVAADTNADDCNSGSVGATSDERAGDTSRHSPDRDSYLGTENYVLLNKVSESGGDPCIDSDTEKRNSVVKSPSDFDTYSESPSLLEEYPSGPSLTLSLSGNESDSFSDSLDDSSDDDIQGNPTSDFIKHGISKDNLSEDSTPGQPSLESKTKTSPESELENNDGNLQAHHNPKKTQADNSGKNPSSKDKLKGKNQDVKKNPSKSNLKDQMPKLPKAGALSKTDSSKSKSSKVQQLHSQPNMQDSQLSSSQRPNTKNSKPDKEKSSLLHTKSQPSVGSKTETKSASISPQQKKNSVKDKSKYDEENKQNKPSQEKKKSTEGLSPNVEIIPWKKALKDESLPQSSRNPSDSKSMRKNKSQLEASDVHPEDELVKVKDDSDRDETRPHEKSNEFRENEESKISGTRTHDDLTNLSHDSEEASVPKKGKGKLKFNVRRAPNSNPNQESTSEESLHQLTDEQTRVSESPVDIDKGNLSDKSPEQPMEFLSKSTPKQKLKIVVRKSPKRDIPELSEPMSLNETYSDKNPEAEESLSKKETGMPDASTEGQPDYLPTKPVTVKFKSGSKKGRVKLSDEYFVSSSDDSSLDPTANKLPSTKDSVIESSSESYGVSRSRSSSSAISDREQLTDSEDWVSNSSSDATTGDVVGTHSPSESPLYQSHPSSSVLEKQSISGEENSATDIGAEGHSTDESSFDQSQLTSNNNEVTHNPDEDDLTTGNISEVNSTETPYEQNPLASNIYKHEVNSGDGNATGDVPASHLSTESSVEPSKPTYNIGEEEIDTVKDKTVSDLTAAQSPTESQAKKNQLTSNVFGEQSNSEVDNGTSSDISGAHSQLEERQPPFSVLEEQAISNDDNTNSRIYSPSESSFDENKSTHYIVEQTDLQKDNSSSGNNAEICSSSQSTQDQDQRTARVSENENISDVEKSLCDITQDERADTTLHAEVKPESSLRAETMGDKNTKSKQNTVLPEDLTPMDLSGQTLIDEGEEVYSPSLRTHTETLQPDNLLQWNQAQCSDPRFDGTSSSTSVNNRKPNTVNMIENDKAKSHNTRPEYVSDITKQPSTASSELEQNVGQQYSVSSGQGETIDEGIRGTKSPNTDDSSQSSFKQYNPVFVNPYKQLSDISGKLDLKDEQHPVESKLPKEEDGSSLVDSKSTDVDHTSEGMGTVENKQGIKSGSTRKPDVSEDSEVSSITSDKSLKLFDTRDFKDQSLSRTLGQDTSQHSIDRGDVSMRTDEDGRLVEKQHSVSVENPEENQQMRITPDGQHDVHDVSKHHHKEKLETDSLRLTYKEDMSLTKSRPDTRQTIDSSCLPTNKGHDIVYTEKETKEPSSKSVKQKYSDADLLDDNTRPVDSIIDSMASGPHIPKITTDKPASMSDGNKNHSDNNTRISQLEQEKNTDDGTNLGIESKQAGLDKSVIETPKSGIQTGKNTADGTDLGISIESKPDEFEKSVIETPKSGIHTGKNIGDGTDLGISNESKQDEFHKSIIETPKSGIQQNIDDGTELGISIKSKQDESVIVTPKSGIQQTIEDGTNLGTTIESKQAESDKSIIETPKSGIQIVKNTDDGTILGISIESKQAESDKSVVETPKSGIQQNIDDRTNLAISIESKQAEFEKSVIETPKSGIQTGKSTGDGTDLAHSIESKQDEFDKSVVESPKSGVQTGRNIDDGTDLGISNESKQDEFDKSIIETPKSGIQQNIDDGTDLAMSIESKQAESDKPVVETPKSEIQTGRNIDDGTNFGSSIESKQDEFGKSVVDTSKSGIETGKNIDDGTNLGSSIESKQDEFGKSVVDTSKSGIENGKNIDDGTNLGSSIESKQAEFDKSVVETPKSGIQIVKNTDDGTNLGISIESKQAESDKSVVETPKSGIQQNIDDRTNLAISIESKQAEFEKSVIETPKSGIQTGKSTGDGTDLAHSIESKQDEFDKSVVESPKSGIQTGRNIDDGTDLGISNESEQDEFDKSIIETPKSGIQQNIDDGTDLAMSIESKQAESDKPVVETPKSEIQTGRNIDDGTNLGSSIESKQDEFGKSVVDTSKSRIETGKNIDDGTNLGSSIESKQAEFDKSVVETPKSGIQIVKNTDDGTNLGISIESKQAESDKSVVETPKSGIQQNIDDRTNLAISIESKQAEFEKSVIETPKSGIQTGKSTGDGTDLAHSIESKQDEFDKSVVESPKSGIQTGRNIDDGTDLGISNESEQDEFDKSIIETPKSGIQQNIDDGTDLAMSIESKQAESDKPVVETPKSGIQTGRNIDDGTDLAISIESKPCEFDKSVAEPPKSGIQTGKNTDEGTNLGISIESIQAESDDSVVKTSKSGIQTGNRNEDKKDADTSSLKNVKEKDNKDDISSGIRYVEEKDKNITEMKNVEGRDAKSTDFRNVEEKDNYSGRKKDDNSNDPSEKTHEMPIDQSASTYGNYEEIISTIKKSDSVPDKEGEDTLPSGISFAATKSPNESLVHQSKIPSKLCDETNVTQKGQKQDEEQPTNLGKGSSRKQEAKSSTDLHSESVENTEGDLEDNKKASVKTCEEEDLHVDECRQHSGHEIKQTPNVYLGTETTVPHEVKCLTENKGEDGVSATQETVSDHSHSFVNNTKPSELSYNQSLTSSDLLPLYYVNSDVSNTTRRTAGTGGSSNVIVVDHTDDEEETKTSTELRRSQSDIQKVQDKTNQDYLSFSDNSNDSNDNQGSNNLKFGESSGACITQQQSHTVDKDNYQTGQSAVQTQGSNGKTNSEDLAKDFENVVAGVTKNNKEEPLSHSHKISTSQDNKQEENLPQTSETGFALSENSNENIRIQESKSRMVENKVTDDFLGDEHSVDDDIKNSGESSTVQSSHQNTNNDYKHDAENKFPEQTPSHTKETLSKNSDTVPDQPNMIGSDKQFISEPSITQGQNNKEDKQMFATLKQNQSHEEYESEEDYGVDERGRDRNRSGGGRQHSDDSRGKEQTQSDYSDDSLTGGLHHSNKTGSKNTRDTATSDAVMVKSKTNDNYEQSSGVVKEDNMAQQADLQSGVMKVDKTSSQMSNDSLTEQKGLKPTDNSSQSIQSSSSRRQKKRLSRYQKDLRVDDSDAYSDDSLASGSNSKPSSRPSSGKRRKRTRVSTEISARKAGQSSDEYADSVNTNFSDDSFTDERGGLVRISEDSSSKISEITDITKSIAHLNSALNSLSEEDIMDDSMTQTEGGSIQMGISPISVWSSSDSGIQPLSGTEMSSCGIQTVINEENSIKSATRRVWNLSISSPHVWGSNQNVAESTAIDDSSYEEKLTYDSSSRSKGANVLHEKTSDVNHPTINRTLPIELETTQPSTVEYDSDGKIKYLVTINEDETKILYNVEKTEYRTYSISDDNTTRKSSHPIIPDSIRINLTEVKTLQTSENFESVQKEKLVYEREGEEGKDAIVSSTFYQEARCVETEQQSENGIVTRENSVERQSVDSDSKSFIKHQMRSPLQNPSNMLEAQPIDQVDSSPVNLAQTVSSSTDLSSSEREEHETSPSTNEMISTDDDTTLSHGNFAGDFISNGHRTLLLPATTSTLIEVQRGSSTDSLSFQTNHGDCDKLHQDQFPIVVSSKENMPAHDILGAANNQLTYLSDMKNSNTDKSDVIRLSSYDESEDVDFDDGYSSVSTLGRQSSVLAYHPDIGEFIISPTSEGHFSQNERDMSVSMVENIVNIQSQTSLKEKEDLSYADDTSVQSTKSFEVTKESSVDPMNLSIDQECEEAPKNVHGDSPSKDYFSTSASANFDTSARYQDAGNQLIGSRSKSLELSSEKGDANQKVLESSVHVDVSSVENLLKDTEQKLSSSKDLMENTNISHDTSGNVNFETSQNSELTGDVQDDASKTFIHRYSSVARTILKPNRQGHKNQSQAKEGVECKKFQSTADSSDDQGMLNDDQNDETGSLELTSNEGYHIGSDFFRKSHSQTQRIPRQIFDSADDIIRKLDWNKEKEASDIPPHQKIIEFFPSNTPHSSSTNYNVSIREQSTKDLQNTAEYLNESTSKGEFENCENPSQSAINIGKIFLDTEEHSDSKDRKSTMFDSVLERKSRSGLLSNQSYLNTGFISKSVHESVHLHSEDGSRPRIYQGMNSEEIRPIQKAIDISRAFLGNESINEKTTANNESESISSQQLEENSKIFQFIHPLKSKIYSIGASNIDRASSNSTLEMNLSATGKSNRNMESDLSGTEFEDSGFHTMTTTDSSLSPDTDDHKSPRRTGFTLSREQTRSVLPTQNIKISNETIEEEETFSVTGSYEDSIIINEQTATKNRITITSEFSYGNHHEDSVTNTIQTQYKSTTDNLDTSTSTSGGKASELYSSDEVYLTPEGNGSGSSSSNYKTPFQSPRQIVDSHEQNMQDDNSYHKPTHSDSLPQTSTKFLRSDYLKENSERVDSLQWELTRRMVKMQSRIRSLSDSAISSDFTEDTASSTGQGINKNSSHSSELCPVNKTIGKNSKYSLSELNRCLINIFKSKSPLYKMSKGKGFVSDLPNQLADLLLDNPHTTQSTDHLDTLFNVNTPARLEGRKWQSSYNISELHGLEIINLLKHDLEESQSNQTSENLKKNIQVTDLDVESDDLDGGDNNMQILKNPKYPSGIATLDSNIKNKKRLVRQKSPSMSKLEIGDPVVKDFEKAHSTGCVDMLDSSSPHQSNSSSNDSITFVFVGDSIEKSDRRYSNPSVCRPSSNTSTGRKGMSESHLAMVTANFQEKVIFKKSSDKPMVGNRSVSSDNVSRNVTEELRRSYSTSLLDVVQIEEPDIEPFPPSGNETDSGNDGEMSNDVTLTKQTNNMETSSSSKEHSTTFSQTEEVETCETSVVEYSRYKKPILVSSMVQTEMLEQHTPQHKDYLVVCQDQEDILSVELSDESGILSDANTISVSSTSKDSNNWTDRKSHENRSVQHDTYREQTKSLVSNSTQTDDTKGENLNLSNSETQTMLSPFPETMSHSSAQVQTDGEKESSTEQTGPTNRAIMEEIVEMKREHGKMMDLLKSRRERPSKLEILSSMKASMSDSSESISPVTVIHKSADTSPTMHKPKLQLVDDDTQTDINLNNSSDRLLLNVEHDNRNDSHKSHDGSESYNTSYHGRLDNQPNMSDNRSELDKSLSDCLVYVPIGKDNKRYFVKPAEFRESLQKSLHTEEKSTETTTTRTATKSTGSLQEELDKLQKERIEIIDLLNLNYLPASLTVELLEAKLNHCIGQTDAILESLEDTWNDDDISYRPAPSVEHITEITKEYIDKYRSELKQSKKDFSVIKEEIERKISKGRGRRRSRTSDLIRMTRKAQIDAFKLERMREQQNYERIRSKSPLVTPPASPHRSPSTFNPQYLTPRQRIDHLVSLRKNIVASSEEDLTEMRKSFSPSYSERSFSPDYYTSYRRSSAVGNTNQQQSFSLYSPDVSFTLNISPPGSRFSSLESYNRSPERVAYISLPYQQYVAEVLDPALLLQESAEMRQRNHQEITRAHSSLQHAKHAQKPPPPFRTSSPDIKNPSTVREYSPLTPNHGISKADIDKDIENLKQLQQMKAAKSSAVDRSVSPTISEASSTSMASYAAYAKDVLVRSERSIRHSQNRQSNFFDRDISPRPDTPSSIYSGDLDSLPDSTSTPRGSRPITSQDIRSRIERRKTAEVKKKKCG